MVLIHDIRLTPQLFTIRFKIIQAFTPALGIQMEKKDQRAAHYATVTQLLVVFVSLITWLPQFTYLYLR